MQTPNIVVIDQTTKLEHLEQIFRIWELCFQAPYNIFESKNYLRRTLNLAMVAQDGDQVAAVAGVINFQMMLEGKAIPCAGIAAVATHPTYRRQGFTRQLLQNILSQLHEREIPLACLWPFSYQFYEHFGWSTTDLQFDIEVSPSSLPNKGKASNYREISPSDFGSLEAAHQEWIQRFNLSLQRPAGNWQRMLAKQGNSWLLLEHKDGYMLVSRNDHAEGSFVVREWCYLSDEAFLDGLAIFRSLDSQFTRVRWTAPEIDSLLRHGVPIASPSFKVKPGMMTRIVNFRAFEKLLPKALEKTIKIIDPLEVSNTDNGEVEIGPGEIVQLTTGFFPASSYPESFQGLHNLLGSRKTFSIEKF